MRTNKIRNKWHDLEKLESALKGLKEDPSYQSNFTSLDRINELQQLFSLIKNNLIHYAFEEGDEIHGIRDELKILRGFISNIVQEWESCIAELDWISKKLVTSTVKEVQIDAAEKEIPDASELSAKLIEVNINEEINSKKNSTSKYDSKRKNDKEIYGKPYISKFELSKLESAEFEILLSQLEKSPNMKLNDTRNMKNGELYLSIHSMPTYEERKIIMRLVKLGLEIWPGKRFLNYG